MIGLWKDGSLRKTRLVSFGLTFVRNRAPSRSAKAALNPQRSETVAGSKSSEKMSSPGVVPAGADANSKTQQEKEKERLKKAETAEAAEEKEGEGNGEGRRRVAAAVAVLNVPLDPPAPLVPPPPSDRCLSHPPPIMRRQGEGNAWVWRSGVPGG